MIGGRMMTGRAMAAGGLAALLAIGAARAEEPTPLRRPDVALAATALPAAMPPPAATAEPKRDPTRGAVTNLPLPRYVTLKTGEGNARRGPGLTHRIDWVFKRAGMPLKITAEYENWRRIEDPEGVGGWVHYSLLSGVRSVLVTEDMVEFRAKPEAQAMVTAQAELGVVARLLDCTEGWCRIGADGNRGWVPRGAIWGVDPGEMME